MAKKPAKKASRRLARSTARTASTAKRVVKKTATGAAAKKAATRKPVARVRVTSGGSALVGVLPSITANDVAASIAWYRDVLGFSVVQEWKAKDQVTGAEMKSGAVTFYINQDDWKQGRDRAKGQGLRLFVTTGPDIDGYAQAIRARGGVLAGDPTSEWGVRAFAITDPDGFKLTFMTPLPQG